MCAMAPFLMLLLFGKGYSLRHDAASGHHHGSSGTYHSIKYAFWTASSTPARLAAKFSPPCR